MKRYVSLFEAFVDADKIGSVSVEIYKNPTSDELNEMSSWARGIIDTDGNLYCINSLAGKQLGEEWVIHQSIIKILSDRGLVEFANYNRMPVDTLNNFLAVVREQKTKTFMLGESYDPSITGGKYKGKLEQYKKKFERINSHLKLKIQVKD